MKRPSWQRGERLHAEVVELASDGDLICAIDGRLLRVKNRTGRVYRVQDSIELMVVSTNPLELRLPDSRVLNRAL